MEEHNNEESHPQMNEEIHTVVDQNKIKEGNEDVSPLLNENKINVLPIYLLIILAIIFFIVLLCVRFKSKNKEIAYNESSELASTTILESSIESEPIIESVATASEGKVEIPFTNDLEMGTFARGKVATRSKIDKFCFAGDISFASHMRESYDEKGINGIICREYRDLISDADFSMANLESPITDDEIDKEDKTYIFSTPTKYTKALKELNFDLYSLANNHMLDFGEKGLNDTIKKLNEYNINYIGAGKNILEASKPYILQIEGKTYAIVAASAVLPYEDWKADDDNFGVYDGYDIGYIGANILRYKNYVDKVIVYMHWGKELSEVATDLQRSMAYRLIDDGADLVIGTHSHTVEEIEFYKGVPIVYSLGNFIYGGTSRDTILLEVSYDYSEVGTGEVSLRIYPGLADYEQAYMYTDENYFAYKCQSISANCRKCIVTDNGKVVRPKRIIRKKKTGSNNNQVEDAVEYVDIDENEEYESLESDNDTVDELEASVLNAVDQSQVGPGIGN